MLQISWGGPGRGGYLTRALGEGEGSTKKMHIFLNKGSIGKDECV